MFSLDSFIVVSMNLNGNTMYYILLCTFNETYMRVTLTVLVITFYYKYLACGENVAT